ncbi:hypothetical protein [Planktothrix paucivesiculata]|uniref:hypothetical protein n=1 Tax=Planktothrix paucivesiculata TaxID=1678308 RepID=UPI0009FB5421|nr:hypothetical protein [Planktothrix paucivesiculata]
MTTEREYQEWRERRNRKRTLHFPVTSLSSATIWKVLGLLAIVSLVLVLHHHSIREDSLEQPSPDYPLLEELGDGKQI